MAARKDKLSWYNSIQENNLAMAVASLPVSTVKIPAKPENDLWQLVLKAPVKPPLRFREDSGCPPGYYLAEVEDSMHPEDFKWFMKEVEPCGTLDGQPVVYALDYIRWILKEEER